MSPEQDGKLFCPEAFHTYAQAERLYYRAWSQFDSEKWTGQPIFPAHMTKEELQTARREFHALPEHFYSRFPWLPVITQENYWSFQKHMKSRLGIQTIGVTLWSWCSGSSRLTATMASLSFLCMVGPPIDLRYGWDIRQKACQETLVQADKFLKPLVTTFEPRCKYWSRAGNRRDPDDTERLRLDEFPQLKFMATHGVRLANEKRHGLYENQRLQQYGPSHL